MSNYVTNFKLKDDIQAYVRDAEAQQSITTINTRIDDIEDSMYEPTYDSVTMTISFTN